MTLLLSNVIDFGDGEVSLLFVSKVYCLHPFPVNQKASGAMKRREQKDVDYFLPMNVKIKMIDRNPN